MLISWRGTNLRFGEWCCLDSVFGFFGGPNHTIHLRRRCSPGSLGAPFIKNTTSCAESKSMSTDPLLVKLGRNRKLTRLFWAPKKKGRLFLDAKSEIPSLEVKQRPTWKIEFPGIVRDKSLLKWWSFPKTMIVWWSTWTPGPVFLGKSRLGEISFYLTRSIKLDVPNLGPPLIHRKLPWENQAPKDFHR